MKPPKSEENECIMKYSKYAHNDHILEDTLLSHPFNRMVSIFIPETMHVNDAIHNVLRNGDCCGSDEFYVVSLPITALMDKLFVEAFIKKGELTLVSYEVGKSEMVLAIQPNGVMTLLIENDFFYQLCIPQSSDICVKKLEKDKKWMVTINLKSKSFVPGNKNYEKVCNSFKSTMHQVALVWKPDDENVCPISIKRYLEKDFSVKCAQMEKQTHVLYNNHIPNLTKSSESFFDWFFYYVSLSEASESDHGNFKKPNFGSNMTESGQALTISWVGVLPTSNILSLFSKLKNYITERPEVPFIGLHIEGFSETPISFKNEPHRSHIYEANDISFIIQNDGMTRMCLSYPPFY